MRSLRIPHTKRLVKRGLVAVVSMGALSLAACTSDTEAGSAPETSTVTASADPSSPATSESAEPSATGETSEPGSATTATELTSNTSTNRTTQPSETDPLAPLGTPDTGRKENWDFSGTSLDITSVRTATHDTFDRVVFDISGSGTPGWVVEHTHSPVSQGSGFPIDYVGTVAMSVNLLGFTGPLQVSGMPGTEGVVTDIVQDINHHGTSQLIIGLQEQTPFSVTLLEGPTRLVIDILHPETT